MSQDVVFTPDSLNDHQLAQAVSREDCGAGVVFEGRVRNHHQGRGVAWLEYECYAPMAVAEVSRIVAQAQARWPLGPVRVSHRFGKLVIGDVAVVVAVASAHRQEAFEAAMFIMDEIKHRAPVWKKEFYNDGSCDWVFCRDHQGPHAHAGGHHHGHTHA